MDAYVCTHFPADDFDDALQEILIALIAVARKKRIEVLR